MEKKLIINVGEVSLEEFREAAIKAKELGATNMVIDCLPKSWWMWEDRTNPYPNWSMAHSQLFKIVCPPQIKEYMPVEFIECCMDYVKERCDILTELGMHGALLSNEPFWLPEEVFRDHPSWRGARCDHPRRSTKPYYSPCIDNEEVLEMYRYAMKTICEETGINFFSIKSNDCGGGICWSNGTYTGPNGPVACEHRSMGDRITGFMDALTEGAKEGNVNAMIHFNADLEFKMPEYSVNMVWPRLKDNQVVGKRDKFGNTPILEAPALRKTFIYGIPNMIALSKNIETIQAAKDKEYVMLNLPKTDLSELWIYTKQALNKNPIGMVSRIETLRDAALDILEHKIISDKLTICADTLVEVWNNIYEGMGHLSHTGLDLVQYGCFNQRWLNRPFVLFPEELTKEEYSYFRPFQFQALTVEKSYDLLNMQDIECARGFSGMFLITETCKKAINSMNNALQGLKIIDKHSTCKEFDEKIDRFMNRISVYICLMKNIIHAVSFQELVDRTNYTQIPREELRWPTRNNSKIEEFQHIIRTEIDNCYELASLLEKQEGNAIAAVDPEFEDCFTYSRLLPEQLRKKISIMLGHELDGKRVYETHNI